MHAEDRTEAPDLPAGWPAGLRAAELPGEQAPLPARPARPGPPAPVRVPPPPAGEAEAPGDVRRHRDAVPAVLRRGEPPDGRDGFGAATPPGDAAGRRGPAAGVRPVDAPGPAAGL